MPDKVDIMADSVQERVGRAEQEIHTLKNQVMELREWPPRILANERNIDSLVTNMIHVQKSQQEIKDDMRHSFQDLTSELKEGLLELRAAVSVNEGEKNGFNRALKWITALVGIATIGTYVAIWYSELSSISASKNQSRVVAECMDGTYITGTNKDNCKGNGGLKKIIPLP